MLWTLVMFKLIWCATVLIGTSYIVFWLGYSGWWWLLAVLLMSGSIDFETSGDKR